MSSDGLEAHIKDELVNQAFRSGWDAFYAWEQEYSRNAISSLQLKSPAISDDYYDFSLTMDIESKDVPENWPCFEITDLPSGPESATPLTRKLPQLLIFSDVFPERPLTRSSTRKDQLEYESCTPTSRSLFVGDDSPVMPFIPLADAPGFEIPKECQAYKYFAWMSLRNPDTDLIVLEAQRLLVSTDPYQTLRLSLADSKLTYHFLQQTLQVHKVNSLSDLRLKRDIIRPPSTLKSRMDNKGKAREPPVPPPRPPEEVFWKSVFHEAISVFCSSQNCLTGYCSAHIDLSPPIQPVAATLRSAALFNGLLEACGDECFVHNAKSTISIGTVWTAEDKDLLSIILQMTPDLTPCDLAIICRKPCNETFRQRQLMIPDSSIPILQHPKRAPSKNRLSEQKFRDLDSRNWSPNDPCSHPGPCDSTSNCACFENYARCTRGCRCSSKCTRRNTGCACSRRSRTGYACQTSSCPCYLANRECDPEVCLKCEAKYHASPVCQNVAIQRGLHKQTKVKRSAFGLGLLLMEEVQPMELITEYVGDLIYEETTRSRDPVSRYLGRNYLFGLNESLSIDSMYAGSVARYINHDPDKMNCLAVVKLVNGDHRIGIYAEEYLDAGTELWMKYGDTFFRTADDTDTIPEEDEEGTEKGEGKMS